MLKYEEIIKYIKNDIKNKKLSHLRKLPSIRSVQQLFQCSTGTVIKAYEKLEQDHIIYSVPKSGYYIVDDFQALNSSEHSIVDFSAVNLSADIFPYKDFQHCLNKSINLYKEKLFSYSDPRGLNSLINVLIKQIQNYQIFRKPDNLIIASSAQQALNILSIMPFPTAKPIFLWNSQLIMDLLSFLSLTILRFLVLQEISMGLILEELEKLFKYGNIKFFYCIPRFHNPTGTSYTKTEKQQILKLAQKYDVYIVEDDIAADLDTNRKNDPIISYDTFSKVIYLKSYSKVIMTGLRVAAIILPDLLINTFLEYKSWTDMNSPILSQGALEIYIKTGMFDSHMKQLLNLYKGRMKCLKNTLYESVHPKIQYNIPDSGYFGCLRVDDPLDYDKLMATLKHKNIKIFNTSQCFLKEHRCNNYFQAYHKQRYRITNKAKYSHNPEFY